MLYRRYPISIVPMPKKYKKIYKLINLIYTYPNVMYAPYECMSCMYMCCLHVKLRHVYFVVEELQTTTIRRYLLHYIHTTSPSINWLSLRRLTTQTNIILVYLFHCRLIPPLKFVRLHLLSLSPSIRET